MNKHRTQEEIIADILAIVLHTPKKTHIMYGANLSYHLLCKYLDMLLVSGLVLYRPADKVYELTTPGKDYLDLYLEFKQLEEQLTQHEVQFYAKKSALTSMLKGET